MNFLESNQVLRIKLSGLGDDIMGALCLLAAIFDQVCLVIILDRLSIILGSNLCCSNHYWAVERRLIRPNNIVGITVVTVPVRCSN